MNVVLVQIVRLDGVIGRILVIILELVVVAEGKLQLRGQLGLAQGVKTLTAIVLPVQAIGLRLLFVGHLVL